MQGKGNNSKYKKNVEKRVGKLIKNIISLLNIKTIPLKRQS